MKSKLRISALFCPHCGYLLERVEIDDKWGITHSADGCPLSGKIFREPTVEVEEING